MACFEIRSDEILNSKKCLFSSSVKLALSYKRTLNVG